MMKLHKFAALGLVLALSLTACGQNPPAPVPSTAPPEAPTAAVTTAPTEEWDTLTLLRQDMEPSGSIAGVMFLGAGEAGISSESIRTNMEQKGYYEEYPFLRDIGLENTVQTEGYELYCIVPTDPRASVLVSQWDAMENVTGDVLYQSESGEPFLLMCNVSDIMPNVVISIVDSTGNLLELYSPGISLKDGTVLLSGEDQPMVLDLTIY